MSIEITETQARTEKEFLILDGQPDQKGFLNGIRVHPWHRYVGTKHEDHSVYVSVGWFGVNREIARDEDGKDEYQNVIVNREDFVGAILAVFPELKRAYV